VNTFLLYLANSYVKISHNTSYNRIQGPVIYFLPMQCTKTKIKLFIAGLQGVVFILPLCTCAYA